MLLYYRTHIGTSDFIAIKVATLHYVGFAFSPNSFQDVRVPKGKKRKGLYISRRGLRLGKGEKGEEEEETMQGRREDSGPVSNSFEAKLSLSVPIPYQTTSISPLNTVVR